MLSQYLFFFLSFVAVFSALMVIFEKNPVHSVLYLVITFFAIAGHFLILNAQFLFIVHIIVYAGAIMVLFLFVIMLMNLNSDTEPQKNMLVQFAAVISGGALLLVLVAALKTSLTGLEGREVDLANASDIGLINNLGRVLFTDFVFPFEIASVLFLSAMIGAVVLGKKDKDLLTIDA